MGTLHSGYDSSDLADVYGNVAMFDMDSTCCSLHGKSGCVWNMADGHAPDIHGRYIRTQAQRTDETLTSRDRFSFDDMNCSRAPAWGRNSYSGNAIFKPCTGLAYEHEFAGSCEFCGGWASRQSRALRAAAAQAAWHSHDAHGRSSSLVQSWRAGLSWQKAGLQWVISGGCNVMHEF